MYIVDLQILVNFGIMTPDLVNNKWYHFLSSCCMVSVLLRPTAVLVIRGEPGWEGHGSHTLSALSGLGCGSRTGCGRGHGALYRPVPEAPHASPLESEAQPRLLRTGQLRETRWFLHAPFCLGEFESSSGIDEEGTLTHIRLRVWSWLLPLMAVCPWMSDCTSPSQLLGVESGVIIPAPASMSCCRILCNRSRGVLYTRM